MATLFHRPDLEWLRPLHRALIDPHPPAPYCRHTWNPNPSEEDWRRHHAWPMNPIQFPVTVQDLAESVFAMPLRFAVFASELHSHGHSIEHALRVAYNCNRQFHDPTEHQMGMYCQDLRARLRARETSLNAAELEILREATWHYCRRAGWNGFHALWSIEYLAQDGQAHEGLSTDMEEGAFIHTLYRMLREYELYVIEEERQSPLERVQAYLLDPSQAYPDGYPDDRHPDPEVRSLHAERGTGMVLRSGLELRGGDSTHSWDRLLLHSLDGVQIPRTRDAFLRGRSLERGYFDDILTDTENHQPSADEIIQASIDEQTLHAGDFPVISDDEIFSLDSVFPPSLEELQLQREVHELERGLEEVEIGNRSGTMTLDMQRALAREFRRSTNILHEQLRQLTEVNATIAMERERIAQLLERQAEEMQAGDVAVMRRDSADGAAVERSRQVMAHMMDRYMAREDGVRVRVGEVEDDDEGFSMYDAGLEEGAMWLLADMVLTSEAELSEEDGERGQGNEVDHEAELQVEVEIKIEGEIESVVGRPVVPRDEGYEEIEEEVEVEYESVAGAVASNDQGYESGQHVLEVEEDEGTGRLENQQPMGGE